jgi:fatty acid-binding protein DegV
VDVAVQHLGAEDRAQALADRLRARLPNASVWLREVSAVIGAHVGPGMVAVSIAPHPG